jgi:hypothetical protein
MDVEYQRQFHLNVEMIDTLGRLKTSLSEICMPVSMTVFVIGAYICTRGLRRLDYYQGIRKVGLQAQKSRN